MSSKREIHRTDGAAVVRCAIYTRKSSEEGLEQEFNSLDAQREACEAYVLSQKSSGWVALPDMYDDGGISGSTLERPSLQRLLADIAAGRIDTIVVYKVDRLTRSLSDFAKIVDAFDAKGVSFVSVTQQFNTTTSMGRLTLNMLLSFAQFEREVTGERIRDKIAASKQKGMWMGGNPPLGYDVADRKLVVNTAEAETVRHIFRRYADLKSVLALQQDLSRSGIVSKVRFDRHGRKKGGVSIARGALYLMLQNRIYLGEIVHIDNAYPGLHEPILDKVLWDEVQDALAENRVQGITRENATEPSLLAGLVYDDSGEAMSPTHANKKGTRYRYYVSHSLIQRGRSQASDVACRVPAADLECIVEDCVRALLKDDDAIFNATGPSSITSRKKAIKNAADLAGRWPTLSASHKRVLLHALVDRVDIRAKAVEVSVQTAVLPEVVRPNIDMRRLPAKPGGKIQVLIVPAQLRRTGMETKLLIHGTLGAELPRRVDRSLLRLIAMARLFSENVTAGDGRSIKGLAADAGVSPSYFTRVFRLSFLAPEITKAIIQGRQPSEFSASKLARFGTFASRWSDQRRQFGFD